MSRRLLLLLLTTLLAVVVSFGTFTPAQGVAVIRFGGYWLILASVVAFGVVLTRSLRDAVPEIRTWRTWLAPVALAIAAAGFLHLHEKHEFKIVADEVVLQLTAKEMHVQRQVSVVVRGYDYAGNFLPLVSYVDKRPLLFPFLLSAVHDVSGFRPANVYALNAVISVALMVLVLLIGRRLGGWPAGIAAVLLLTTVPLVAQNACGGGFELLNLTMIALTIWLGMRAADRPEDDDRLGAFVLSGVLLAQTRYESVLFVLPVAGAVLYLWVRQRAVRLPWSLLAAPLFIITCPLHFNVFKVSAATWQLNDIAGADHPFGFRYFYDNVGHALNFFLCVDGTQSNSVLVAVAGALGFGFFALVLYREHRALFRNRPDQAVLALFLIGLFIHSLFMLCYFWGTWDDPVIRRLSLPAHLLLIFALVFVWSRMVAHPRRWAVLSTVALVYLVAMTVPTNVQHRYTQENFAARATNWLGGHIRALGDESALAVDGNSGLEWFLYGKSNVTAQAIARRPDAFLYHFRNRSFANYFVVQRVTPILGTGMRGLNHGDDLGDGVELQTVEEKSFAPLYFVRLARIVKIDEAKFRAWAKDRIDHPEPERPAGAGTTAAAAAAEEHLREWVQQLP